SSDLDRGSLLARRRRGPAPVEIGELLYFGHVGRLAQLAAGLVVLAEFGPLQLQLAGRRELVGRGIGGRQTVLESPPDRHHGLAGEDAIPERLALRGLAVELDADLAPGFPDQLEDIGLLGRLAGGLDDDLERPAVGQLADAVAAALQADLVEELVGALSVVARPR